MLQGDFFSMLVDLEQWRAAIGALGLSLPCKMGRKVLRGAGFVPSLSVYALELRTRERNKSSFKII